MASLRLKHNPSHMSDAELIRDFVVRQHDLELVLERLREHQGASNQHLLILGPRGMGKTTLINRVIAEVRRDPGLGGKWYPIAFNEESYTVTSAAELWLQALVHLAEQTRDRALAAVVDQLRQERDDTRLRDRALARLMEFADAQNKRLIVVLENIDMLFEQQMGEADGWDIRHTLQNEPRLMVLATSTTRLDAFHDSDKPLFELFWEHALERLDLPEIQAVWRMVAGDELPLHRARPIQILTGGNTRLLVILASFARGRSFRELLTELVALIDENTPYFKHNVESLPPEERKVFVTLADLWQPSSSRQVADVARTEIRKTSAMLGRLAGRGAVEEVRRIDHTKLYQVAERMYNLYHLLRGRNNERVRALVEFIIRFYDRGELHELIPSIAGEACASETEGRGDIVHAFFQLIERLPTSEDRRAMLERAPAEFRALPEAAEDFARLFRACDSASPRREEAELRARLAEAPDDAGAWMQLGDVVGARGERAEAMQCFQAAWQIDPSRPEIVAGMALLRQPVEDWEAFLAELGAIREQARDAAEPLARALYAHALAMTSRGAEARAEIGELVERWAHHSRVAALVGAVLQSLGDADSAIEALSHALDIDPHNLMALEMLAQVLERAGRYSAAIEVLRSGIDRFPAHEALQTRLFDILVGRFGDLEAAWLAIEQAHAANPDSVAIMQRMASVCVVRVDLARAASLYEAIMAREPSSATALAWIRVLISDGQVDRAEALTTAWEALEQDGNRMSARALVLGARGRFTDAAALLVEAQRLTPESGDVLALLIVAHARAGEPEAARRVANAWIAAHEGPAALLACAQAVGIGQVEALYEDAFGWAERAVALAPNDVRALLTSMSLAIAFGRTEAALHALPGIMRDTVGDLWTIAPIMAGLLSLVAVGRTRQVLQMLESSPRAPEFEPFIVALRRSEGLEINPPQEIREVADDMLQIIEKWQRKHNPTPDRAPSTERSATDDGGGPASAPAAGDKRRSKRRPQAD